MGSIGVFDSGVGGLSVWREIVKVLPNTSTVYYADNANCPYGDKSQQEIIRLADRVTAFLLSKGCSMVVVACNTATAAAIEFLRAKYSIPFVGMEPAVKPAAVMSKTGVIGVLATRGTFNGRLFQETSSKYAADVRMLIQPGYGLVELVEVADFSSPKVFELLRKYLEPMLDAGADHLVLGCTHYPFLIEAINEIAEGKLIIVDPASAVAAQVKRVFGNDHSPNDSGSAFYTFYSSGDCTPMKRLIELIGEEQLIDRKKINFDCV